MTTSTVASTVVSIPDLASWADAVIALLSAPGHRDAGHPTWIHTLRQCGGFLARVVSSTPRGRPQGSSHSRMSAHVPVHPASTSRH
jgi:hypothetical protein